ncbi:unnamed protein product [Polarella glacialis]|uniref:Uncharacterized protein n=1 Tax=Polarella glacialis TaxID=89957 RepID=A0A813D8C0_POLGL|nr:unnamed protein product [Polarella glacialis]CAE8685622.1 unnamed protein product [Polarella glacialis]
MKSWAIAPSNTGGRPWAQKRPKKDTAGADPPFATLLVHTAKQTLFNAAHVREHDAVLQHVIILPGTHPVCASLQQCGKQFATQVKNQPSADIGSPHLHKWAALIATLGSLTLTEPQKVQLTEHAQTMDSPQKLAQSVFVCKLSKAWIKDTFKLTISPATDMEAIAELVCTVLTANGGTRKFGIPPRSSQERDIAKILVDMGEFSNP